MKKGLTLGGEQALTEVLNPLQAELQLTVDLEATTAKRYGLKLENELGEYLSVAFNPLSGNLEVDRTHSRQDKFEENFFKRVHTVPLEFQKQSLELQILIDAASIEVFVDGGARVYSGIFFPTKDYQSLSLFAEAGKWHLEKLAGFDLAGIWERERDPTP